MAQEKVITGTIGSEADGILPGTSVAIKGTNIGTVTNADGKFTLKIPAGYSTFTVSSIGYATSDYEIKDKSFFEILVNIPNISTAFSNSS